jgi:hypothetical protein
MSQLKLGRKLLLQTLAFMEAALERRMDLSLGLPSLAKFAK